MTVDTATLRQQYERFDRCTSGEQVGFLGCALADKVPELCDALDEMRTERDSWQADVERLHGDLAHSMDRIAEEMAALDEERERARQLCEAVRRCMRWMDSEDINDHDQIEADQQFARAALATAGEEGAAT